MTNNPYVGRLHETDLVMRAKWLRGLLLEEMPVGAGLDELWHDLRQASIWDLRRNQAAITEAMMILGSNGELLLNWMLRQYAAMPERQAFWLEVNSHVHDL
jgi:hypothetical protein